MLRGIHKLCDKALWDETRIILKDPSPEANDERMAARQPGGYGEWTSLHIACKKNAPTDIISELCLSGSESPSTFDLYNKLPIHYSAEYGTNIESLLTLLDKCPDSVSTTDHDGLTPLLLSFKYSTQLGPDQMNSKASRSLPSLNEIELLLDQENSVVWTGDQENRIPLHYAALNICHYDLDVFQTLVDADVNTVLGQTKDGMTPLQLALMSCSPQVPICEQKVKVLLGISCDGKDTIEDDFDATRILCNRDMIPLHYAAQNISSIPIEVMHLLLDRCKEAASSVAPSLGVPLDIIESFRERVLDVDDLISFNEKSDLVFAYNPDLLPYRNEKDRMRRICDQIVSHATLDEELSNCSRWLWIWLCTFPDDDDPEGIYPATVKSILEMIKGDEDRKKLISIEISDESQCQYPLYLRASNSIKDIFSPYLRFLGRYELKQSSVNFNPDSSMVIHAVDRSSTNKDHGYHHVVIKFFSEKKPYETQVSVYRKIQGAAAIEGLPVPVIPMLHAVDLDNIDTSRETKDDLDFARDISQTREDGIDLSAFRHAIVLANQEYNTRVELSFDDPKLLKRDLKDIAQSIYCLHRSCFVNGGICIKDFSRLKERLSLKDISSVSLSNLDVYGSVLRESRTFYPTPEMTVKLDSKGLKKYEKYWRPVMNDSKLSHLWRKIQPRKVEEDFFVMKYFRHDENGEVHSPTELPYDPILKNESLDTWNFGVLMFECVTGESLFHYTRDKRLVSDTDYKVLFDWSTDEAPVKHRFADIRDYLARDLLRATLAPKPSERISMELVLKHPYFCFEEEDYDNYHREICQIVKEREEKIAVKEIERQETNEEKRILEERTDRLQMISIKAQLKFERSQLKQIMWEGKHDHINFPTSCLLLPYKLRHDLEGIGYLSDEEAEIKLELQEHFTDVLIYLSLVSDIKVRWKGLSVMPTSEKSSAPALTFEGSNLVQICSGIVKEGRDAEALIKLELTKFTDDEHASAMAKTIVSDALKDVIDYDICKEIVVKATNSKKSLSSLLKVTGALSDETVQHFLEEHMKVVLHPEFVRNPSKKKTEAKEVLSSLILEFSSNILLAATKRFESALNKLIAVYESVEDCFIYLVDEFNGKALVSTTYPCQVPLSSEVLTTFIPTTILLLKSNFQNNLQNLLGFDGRSSRLDHFKFGSFSKSKTAIELRTLLCSVESRCNGGNIENDCAFERRDELLSCLKVFFDTIDPNHEFSGLRRLRSPNGLVLWTTALAKNTILKEYQEELESESTRVQNDYVTGRGISSIQSSETRYSTMTENVANAQNDLRPYYISSSNGACSPTESNSVGSMESSVLMATTTASSSDSSDFSQKESSTTSIFRRLHKENPSEESFSKKSIALDQICFKDRRLTPRMSKNQHPLKVVREQNEGHPRVVSMLGKKPALPYLLDKNILNRKNEDSTDLTSADSKAIESQRTSTRSTKHLYMRENKVTDKKRRAFV